MPYEIGSADSHIHLLEKLKDFLSSEDKMGDQAYEILRWEEDEDGERELAVKGPGLAGNDEVFSSIRTHSDGEEDLFNWELRGMSGYDIDKTFEEQPGCRANDYLPKVLLSDFSMTYWFVASGRRFIVVAKVSTIYAACYMGLFWPYISKDRLPYPYFFAGDNTYHHRWSVDHNNHRHGLIDPFNPKANDDHDIQNNHASTARLYDSEWHNIQTARDGSTDSEFHKSATKSLYPLGGGNTRDLIKKVKNNVDETYTLIPVIPFMTNPEGRIWGEIDGVYWVSGFNNPVENRINIDGIDYLVVQNVYRTGIHDYWALKLD